MKRRARPARIATDFFDKRPFRVCNGGVPGPLPPSPSPSTSVSAARLAAPRAAAWRARVTAAAALAALVGFALEAPIGPSAIAGAALDGAARAQALRGGLDAGASALWLLLARAAGLLPFGDVASRALFVSVACGALAVALALGRCLPRAGDDAGLGDAAPAPAQLVAAALAVAAAALSRSFFAAATEIGPAAAGVALGLAALRLAERVARAPADGRAGLALALVAGLAAGGPLAAAALGWPVGLLLVLWALRRGERWPLLAPLVFVAGAGVSLLLVVRAPGGAPLGAFAHRLTLAPVIQPLVRLSPRAVAAAAAALAEEMGVLAVLVAGVGLWAMAGRARALAFTLWPLAVGIALRAASGGADAASQAMSVDGAVGAAVAEAALAVPLAAGTVRLVAGMGSARVPAAAALGVIVAVWPLLAHGLAR
jgi:hypothetical protein